MYVPLESIHNTDWNEESLKRKRFVLEIRSLAVYKWNVNLSVELVCESNKLLFILYDEVICSSVNTSSMSVLYIMSFTRFLHQCYITDD